MSDEKKDMSENKWFTSPEMVEQYFQIEFDKVVYFAVLQIGLQIISKLKSGCFDVMSDDVKE